MHDDLNYYLPSSSDIFKQEERLFVSERKYKHVPGSITLYDWTEQLTKVYGDNAMFALCFYFASLFRDHIFRLFKFFPILKLLENISFLIEYEQCGISFNHSCYVDFTIGKSG